MLARSTRKLLGQDMHCNPPAVLDSLAQLCYYFSSCCVLQDECSRMRLGVSDVRTAVARAPRPVHLGNTICSVLRAWAAVGVLDFHADEHSFSVPAGADVDKYLVLAEQLLQGYPSKPRPLLLRPPRLRKQPRPNNPCRVFAWQLGPQRKRGQHWGAAACLLWQQLNQQQAGSAHIELAKWCAPHFHLLPHMFCLFTWLAARTGHFKSTCADPLVWLAQTPLHPSLPATLTQSLHLLVHFDDITCTRVPRAIQPLQRMTSLQQMYSAPGNLLYRYEQQRSMGLIHQLHLAAVDASKPGYYIHEYSDARRPDQRIRVKVTAKKCHFLDDRCPPKWGPWIQHVSRSLFDFGQICCNSIPVQDTASDFLLHPDVQCPMQRNLAVMLKHEQIWGHGGLVIEPHTHYRLLQLLSRTLVNNTVTSIAQGRHPLGHGLTLLLCPADEFSSWSALFPDFWGIRTKREVDIPPIGIKLETHGGVILSANVLSWELNRAKSSGFWAQLCSVYWFRIIDCTFRQKKGLQALQRRVFKYRILWVVVTRKGDLAKGTTGQRCMHEYVPLIFPRPAFPYHRRIRLMGDHDMALQPTSTLDLSMLGVFSH